MSKHDPNINKDFPHPLDRNWFIMNDDNEIYGPFDGHKIKEYIADGRISSDTQVRRENTKNWNSADADSVLEKLFMPIKDETRNNISKIKPNDGTNVVNVNQTMSLPSIPFTGLYNKSIFVAVILSILICGVGQIYNGEAGKGVLMFIGGILLWIFWLGWIVWIWSIVDAGVVAAEKRNAYLELWRNRG